MMQKYAIRGAESRDIEAIMRVEHQSFAAGIAETQAVFAERLACAARCNYVLLDSGAQSVCGYVTAEIWEMAPFDPALFSLGHSVREQHRPDGTTLYISSFALLPEVRGTRIPRTDIHQGNIKSVPTETRPIPAAIREPFLQRIKTIPSVLPRCFLAPRLNASPRLFLS